MLPLSLDLGGRFDRSLWQAYVSVNKIFADKVMEVTSPDDDYVLLDYRKPEGVKSKKQSPPRSGVMPRKPCMNYPVHPTCLT